MGESQEVATTIVTNTEWDQLLKKAYAGMYKEFLGFTWKWDYATTEPDGEQPYEFARITIEEPFASVHIDELGDVPHLQAELHG